jgi:two-component system, LytTR family, sensor histidine kinase AlgZ
MWSCRLNKIKSSNFSKSITNSDQITDAKGQQTFVSSSSLPITRFFSHKVGYKQFLLELFVASVVLSIVLVLAKAQTWSKVSLTEVIQHVLYIHWVMLSFAALVEVFRKHFEAIGIRQSMIAGFLLLQFIVLVTTLSLNVLMHVGSHFTLHTFSVDMLLDGVVMHLSYGVLLGAFCFRYLFLREQWLRQQHSELHARIHAMQARIHPHFLFNSLNNVISLIAIDPDKAEHMLLNLSRLFRASFQELKLVPLSDEIELCQRYLAIEQIRLGERLEVEWKFENKQLFSTAKIPLLTLQPLLENSIFHGVEKILTKSRISILVEILHNQVNIVITNPYSLEKTSLKKGHGIALDNVKQRLAAYFGESVTFQSYAGKGIFTTVLQYQYK